MLAERWCTKSHLITATTLNAVFFLKQAIYLSLRVQEQQGASRDTKYCEIFLQKLCLKPDIWGGIVQDLDSDVQVL